MGQISIFSCDECGLETDPRRDDARRPVGWMLLNIPEVGQVTLCSWTCLDEYGGKARLNPPSENTSVEPAARYPSDELPVIERDTTPPEPPPEPPVRAE